LARIESHVQWLIALEAQANSRFVELPRGNTEIHQDAVNGRKAVLGRDRREVAKVSVLERKLRGPRRQALAGSLEADRRGVDAEQSTGRADRGYHCLGMAAVAEGRVNDTAPGLKR
jgi:hypothetical protein